MQNVIGTDDDVVVSIGHGEIGREQFESLVGAVDLLEKVVLIRLGIANCASNFVTGFEQKFDAPLCLHTDRYSEIDCNTKIEHPYHESVGARDYERIHVTLRRRRHLMFDRSRENLLKHQMSSNSFEDSLFHDASKQESLPLANLHGTYAVDCSGSTSGSILRDEIASCKSLAQTVKPNAVNGILSWESSVRVETAFDRIVSRGGTSPQTIVPLLQNCELLILYTGLCTRLLFF